MPVDHGGVSPELTTAHALAIQINIGETRYQFPGPRASFEYRAFGRDGPKIPSLRVVNTCRIVEEVAHHKVATMEHPSNRPFPIGKQLPGEDETKIPQSLIRVHLDLLLA